MKRFDGKLPSYLRLVTDTPELSYAHRATLAALDEATRVLLPHRDLTEIGYLLSRIKVVCTAIERRVKT